jgi:vacuolar protein sorting-associated protein 13D
VQFERLGIRLLRRKSSSKKIDPSLFSTSSSRHHPSPSVPSLSAPKTPTNSAAARLIAKIMLYGLSVQGTVSADVAIDGHLEGVQVTDLTPESKKYANIAHLGVGGGECNHATKPSSVSEFDDVTRQQALSFSVSRSSRPLTSPISSGTATPPSDVTLRLSVPAIHYTHSVNFVYEMEMFVSDFKFYSSKLADSMRSAAFGVAKGFVSKESHLAKGLGKLHSSFGYTSTNRTANLSTLPEDSIEIEEIDGETETTKVPDRIFIKVLVQSPVIVLPSSLGQDKCLVAHLGKIVVENEFIPEELATQQTDITQSLNTTSFFYLDRSSPPPEVERLTLTVSNISLHATQSKEGRDWLEAAQSEELSSSPECCFKVLKESSISVQINKRFSAKEDLSTTSIDGLEEDTSFTAGEEGTSGNDLSKADIVVTGRICNSLLIVLPKDVFDQIRSTLKHGIRRKPSFRQRRRTTSSTANVPAASESQDKESRTSKTVRFVDSNIESSKKLSSDKPSAAVVSMPKICASFTLPRLSVELQRTIDEKSRSLVYVSLDDFSIQCHRLNPHVTSFDVALKSIVIEDLLQPKESEYRNILTSSVKPLPFISPIPTPSRSSLQRLSSAPSLSTSLSRHLLPIMSTPKPQAATDSPLRAFDPSSVSSSLRKGGGDNSSIFGSRIGNDIPRSWSTGEEGNSQSTLKDETTATIGATNASEVGDLLTVKGMFVEKKCPVYASKYKSVSGVKSTAMNII